MFSSILHTLAPVATLALQLSVPVLGGLIVKRLHTPTDHQRAELLSRIANAAASLVVLKNPTGNWSNLLASTIRDISNAAGLPTTNAAAIEREAAAALTRAMQATAAENARPLRTDRPSGRAGGQ